MAASPVVQSAASGRPFVLFPPSASLLTELRDAPKLAAIRVAVTPASRLEVRPAPEMVSSGIPELDALTGGWPRGCLSEICGAASSGRTSVVLAALAEATQRGEACALIDASDAMNPASAVAAGVVMERLLWIRCGTKNSPQRHGVAEKNKQKFGTDACSIEPEFARRRKKLSEHCLEQVLKVTDLLLQSNGFGMVVLDLADIPVRSARRIPLASWFRFRRAVEHTPTVLLVIEEQPIAGSCSSVLVQVSGVRSQVSGKKPPVGSGHSAFRDSVLSPELSSQRDLRDSGTCGEPEIKVTRLSHTELLDRLEITAELVRSRLERKPAQPVVNFCSSMKWAG